VQGASRLRSMQKLFTDFSSAETSNLSDRQVKDSDRFVSKETSVDELFVYKFSRGFSKNI